MNGNDIKIDKIMFNAFKHRLEYDSLEFKVLLYSVDKGFEYNFKNHTIRPFTSVLWYSVSDKLFESFINYFDLRCTQTIKEFEENGYADESMPYGVGYFYNNQIVIDVDSLNGILKTDKDYMNNHNIDCDELKKSYNYFIKYISDLYTENENILKDNIGFKIQ